MGLSGRSFTYMFTARQVYLDGTRADDDARGLSLPLSKVLVCSQLLDQTPAIGKPRTALSKSFRAADQHR